ncbi:hypothetical protein [Liquorilactobacillus hordei]|uniref:Uncharacterized protein n=1 Tax=Liquorilactobacillus hordei DSM 19519 TaxID=1423759 RepID=A0A0R1MK99_9LACO|nr:hypothetical protein [Liquorilactobacillus hordei]KRL07913.1 hypothetical protein FC92_GL000980 [Liquorilactobacillus hordei DSM 19519]QYH50993.1 hypothetical protein G6O70_00060 [Liquorilactobacillus hordei DSM 19519]QYH51140.1 hypothetical protein G6O70_00855 [Liquorilactobacillus hordei DSM 19519]
MNNKLFDKEKKTFYDRSKHIDRIINEETLNNEIRGVISKNGTIEETNTGNYLDRIANYLLESKDLPSGRKVEYGYYRSERDYRSNFTTGRNTVPISSEIIEQLNEISVNTNKHINKEFIKRLFNPQSLSEDDIRRFIINGCNYTQTDLEELRGAISWLWDVIINECTGREKEVIKMFDGDITVREIAEKSETTFQNIYKILKNICKKTKKWLNNPE